MHPVRILGTLAAPVVHGVRVMFLHAIAPEHRTSTVLALWPQTLIDPSLCPILADALQDAGCDAAHVLDQLRGPRLVSDEAICSAESATWSGSRSRLWARLRRMI